MVEDEVEEFIKTDSAFRAYHSPSEEGEWGSFDVTEILAQITILTASRTLQGAEVRSKLDKTFAQLYTDLDGGFTPLNFTLPNLPLVCDLLLDRPNITLNTSLQPSYRRRDRANAKLTEFYIDIIQARRRMPADDVSSTSYYLHIELTHTHTHTPNSTHPI